MFRHSMKRASEKPTFDFETAFGTPYATVTTFPSKPTARVDNNNNDALVAIDANISSTDDGILVDLGGTGKGVSIGVSNGNLRVRGYTGSGSWSAINDATVAYLEIDISSYTGTFCTYYFAFDNSIKQLKAYIQVQGTGSTYDLVSLGTNSAPTATVGVFGNGEKGYGTINVDTPDIEAAYKVNFNGTIDEVRLWAHDSGLDVSTFGT